MGGWGGRGLKYLSILGTGRKPQFEETNLGQISVASRCTQLHVCTSEPTFATNEQALGGMHTKQELRRLFVKVFDIDNIVLLGSIRFAGTS